MSSKTQRAPDAHVPSDAELLALVRRRPGLSLRELCAELWPDLAWTPGTIGADSATGRVRLWQRSYTAGCGNRAEYKTSAEWLRDRLGDLVTLGRLRHAPRRRDEVDVLASLSYVVPGAELPPAAPDPIDALATARRAVSHG